MLPTAQAPQQALNLPQGMPPSAPQPGMLPGMQSSQPQPQGMNITGGNMQGSTSVGGILQIKSIQQMEKERVGALAQAAAPELASLAGHVKKAWWSARSSKETTIEQRMLQSLRQRRGEYDPPELAMLKEQGRSTIYMYLTSNKCRAALSWMKDVLLTAGENKPWQAKPEPVAEVPPEMLQQLMQQAAQNIQQMEMQAAQMGAPPPTDFDIREMMMAMKDQVLAHLQQTAQDSVERMERKMETQLFEGRFIEQFSLFLDDLTTFPSAIFKGPVVRKKPRLQWVPGPNGQSVPDVKDQLVLEWERVDPFMLYPAPDSSTVHDGWLIERHRLQRSDLYALKGVEGYSDAMIDLVLYEYGRGGLHEWLAVDTAKATAEGKSTMGIAQNPSELIDALQYWGPVQGRLLLEWGLDKNQIQDPLADYEVEAWLIGPYIIKASVNEDPLKRKPYYKASWEEIPGAFWGNSVADLCRDTQKICNATARAIVDNVGIASGPQVVVNVDRLPIGAQITQLFPWKIHQVTQDPNSSNRPPIEFFAPPMVAQELLMIYEKFATLADEYTGIPRYMTGDAQVGGAGRTASGMSMLMTNAGKSIKQVISNVDNGVMHPCINRLYFYNMKWGTDPDLKLGGVQIVARGADALLIKEAAQQRQNEFLQIAVSNPLVNQIVGNEGIAEILRENVKTLDMNADSIIPPMPILRKRWADQQAMQMRMAAMQAQGAPGQNQGPPQGGPPGVTPPAAPDRRQLMNGAPVTNLMNPKR